MLECGMSPTKGLIASSLMAVLAIGFLSTHSVGQRPPPGGAAAGQTSGGGRPPVYDWHLFHSGTTTYRYNAYNGDMQEMLTSQGYKWSPTIPGPEGPVGLGLDRFEVAVGDNPNVDVIRIDRQSGTTWMLASLNGNKVWGRLKN